MRAISNTDLPTDTGFKPVVTGAKPAKRNALVIGAGGGIGRAIVNKLLSENFGRVIAISRDPSHFDGNTVEFLQSDYSEVSIKQLCGHLQHEQRLISRVFICNGTLHGESYMPEKRMESIEADTLLTVYQANAVVPIMWIRSLLPLLSGKESCVVSVLSARVGSISDNRLGGWYSYRASKAALNMLLKTAAIEYARRANNVKLIAFHPGTVDTSLSKPFQASVPKEKLFTPDFVAERLFDVMNKVEMDSGLEFIDWSGQTIEW